MPSARLFALAVGAVLVPAAAQATKPKLDNATCLQLRMEETKFRQSGILNDMSKGAAWAKANLSAARMREVEHYLQLNEQIQFGCRDAKLSADAAKASAAAARIELNSDADPMAPVVKDPAKPQPPAVAKTKKAPEKALHKKPKTGDPKSGSLDTRSPSKMSRASGPQLQSPAETGSVAPATAGSAEAEPSLPAFGFGETVVLPFSSSD